MRAVRGDKGGKKNEQRVRKYRILVFPSVFFSGMFETFLDFVNQPSAQVKKKKETNREEVNRKRAGENRIAWRGRMNDTLLSANPRQNRPSIT